MLIETKGLIFIEPGYQRNDGGNITHLQYLNETNPRTLSRPISAVVHQLQRQAHSHFIYSRDELEIWSNCQHCLPIPVDFNTTLFPVQARTAPHSEHDGCTAYLNVAMVNRSGLTNKQTNNREKVIMQFPGGITFQAAANWETLWHHVLEANNVHNSLLLKTVQQLHQLSVLLQSDPQKLPVIPIKVLHPKKH